MKRGTTLVETLAASAITVMTLVGGVACYLSGMMSWAQGTGAMDSMNSSQQGVKFVCNKLRESTSISINTNGTKVTYTLPMKDGDNNYTIPMQSDPTVRFFEVSNGTLIHSVGGQVTTITRGILADDPATQQVYRNFTSATNGVIREVIVQLVTSKKGHQNKWISSRVNESTYLRNVPNLTR
jgi:hypothetical protein